jgi:hypothetical protein
MCKDNLAGQIIDIALPENLCGSSLFFALRIIAVAAYHEYQ